MNRLGLSTCLIVVLSALVYAADPPQLINYQGVLRDSSDKPLDGSFPMTFRFFDALTAGDEILVDGVYIISREETVTIEIAYTKKEDLSRQAVRVHFR